MGDLPDAKPADDDEEKALNKPVMSKIYDTLGRTYKTKKQMEEKYNTKV